MSGSDTLPATSETVRRDARAWVARLAVGEPTLDDARALVSWRATSAAHDEAFQEATALWRALEDPARRAQAAPRPDQTFDRRAVLGGAIAASAAGLMVLHPPLDLWPSLADVIADMKADYKTGPGERETVRLSPMVTAELNTRSRLAVEGKAGSGRVELLSGEAVFDVGGVAKAFVVTAEGAHTHAERAVFNIRRKETGTAVTCLEGVVDIRHPKGDVRLQAGSQLQFTAAALGAAMATDAAAATAWRRGLLVFRDAPLRDVVDELNRYRQGRILLTNAALADRRVNGAFHVDRPDDVLAQIQQGYGGRLRHLPAGVVVIT